MRRAGEPPRSRIRRLGQPVGPLALATLAPILVAAPARAHEVTATEFQAPLPLSWLLVGGGVTVVLTAAWLASGRSVDVREDDSRALFRVPASVAVPVRWVVRLVFIGLVCWAIVAGLRDRPGAATSVATVFVWPVWMRGLALASLVAGSPWRTLSPWWTVHDLLAAVEGGDVALVERPPPWADWVATAGFVVLLGVVENLTAVPRSPRLTVAVVAGYGLVMVLGSVVFGGEGLRRADPLGAFYDLLGRVAPIRAVPDDGGFVARLRFPWRGCLPAAETPALATLAVAAVYTVSFDGYRNTADFQALLFAVRDALGTGQATTVVLYALGLGAFLAAFATAAVVAERLGGGGAGGGVLAFAPTVVPIAAAYEVAHNYPFVVRNVARLATLLAEPVTGPLADPVVLGWLSVPAFWVTQVALVVGGHLIAVVAAHAVATRRYPTAAAARRGHGPLVVVMVGYTVASLWIISRPVVA